MTPVRDRIDVAWIRHRFDIDALSQHLHTLTAVCGASGFPELLVQLTDFDGGNGTVIEAGAAALTGDVSIEMWPERRAGRGYYESVCFKLSIIDNDETIEVADGGFVDWTQKLLGNRKERLMISGLSLERLAQQARPASE